MPCWRKTGGKCQGQRKRAHDIIRRKPLKGKVPETGLEPALPVKATRPSTWRVCQFRHSGWISHLHYGSRQGGINRLFGNRLHDSLVPILSCIEPALASRGRQ